MICRVIFLLSVAFLLCLTHDAFGEYQLTAVATVGDTIDGKTLTSILTAGSVNDHGDVAFRACFSGGCGVFVQARISQMSCLTLA